MIGLGGGEVSSDWFSLSACCLQHTLPLAGLAARLASGPQGPALPLTMSKMTVTLKSAHEHLMFMCLLQRLRVDTSDFWMPS